MNRRRRIPVLRDAVIPGERLRAQGLWLPTRPVPREGLAAAWPESISMDLQYRAERILPVVRKRALRAGTATLRNSLGFDRRDGDTDADTPETTN
ncbi:hypothetical protein [Aquisalimonas asiatica]|uniref:Uncharacterized protein n=1 Tax=Aquisalimonas asiatica TaxID=406100 RepID=A0A1H8R0R0_9GAMM|nr:hypothetical protein [Aquisalimonas asiatica]SEO59936.1 hypothetical protein SAMN04488052_101913 [Aquisalimonas asiatica]